MEELILPHPYDAIALTQALARMNIINPPANEDQCAVVHQTDEYCEVACIIEAGRIFSEFVLDRCAA
jgi:hypothetical protein